MASERAYHHSVLNYHSPFKLDHRNASAFPDQRTIAEREAQDAARRQLDVLASYSSERPAADGSRSTVWSSPPRHLTAGNRVPPPVTHIPGMYPNLIDATNTNSDHFWGARMSPTRMSPELAERMVLAQVGASPSEGPMALHNKHDVPLTKEEQDAAWMEAKYLRFGVHRRARQIPYVARDEYVDPLRCTSPTRLVGASWISRPLNPHHPTSRFGAVRLEVAFGSRRAPAHAAELPEKVTWHKPWLTVEEQRSAADTPPMRSAGSSSTATPTSAADRLDDSRMRRLPATALLTEVEERLRYHGMGSLMDVRHASDEAISALLRDCGFTPTQRMTVLWELRKRYPLPVDLQRRRMHRER
jgi:hypothetical protein